MSRWRSGLPPHCTKVYYGIGIAPEHRERIFGMFQRLHPAGQYGGTGIGLAMVRKVASRMRGRIGLDSDPGRGSTFWLEFSAAPVSNCSLSRSCS